MFESHGFRVLGSENIDMTKYGGNENDGKSWVLVREPHEGGGVENLQEYTSIRYSIYKSQSCIWYFCIAVWFGWTECYPFVNTKKKLMVPKDFPLNAAHIIFQITMSSMVIYGDITSVSGVKATKRRNWAHSSAYPQHLLPGKYDEAYILEHSCVPVRLI